MFSHVTFKKHLLTFKGEGDASPSILVYILLTLQIYVWGEVQYKFNAVKSTLCTS